MYDTKPALCYGLPVLNTFMIAWYEYHKGPSWPWSYGSWIYNYLCNQCLSPLTLWVRIPGGVYSIQHFVIKFVCDLWRVCGFRRDFGFLHQ